MGHVDNRIKAIENLRFHAEVPNITSVVGNDSTSLLRANKMKAKTPSQPASVSQHWQVSNLASRGDVSSHSGYIAG